MNHHDLDPYVITHHWQQTLFKDFGNKAPRKMEVLAPRSTYSRQNTHAHTHTHTHTQTKVFSFVLIIKFTSPHFNQREPTYYVFTSK